MNKLRFRGGQPQLRKAPVRSETFIEAGDFIWLDDDGFARPANEAPDLASFVVNFFGITHQPSVVGETNPLSIDVSTTSVYECDVSGHGCTSLRDTFTAASAGRVCSLLLVPSKPQLAIAVAAEYTVTPSTTVRVTFLPAFGSWRQLQ